MSNETDDDELTQPPEVRVPFMRSHQYMSFPRSVTIEFSDNDMTFLLGLLYQLRTTMTSEAALEVSPEDRRDALYVADHSQELYHAIINQLKLSEVNTKSAN